MTGFDALGQLLEGLFLANENISFAGVTASLLGCVLVVSGASKVRHPRESADAMVGFGILDRPLAPLGLGLALFEILLGADLLVPQTWRFTLPISFLLFASFAFLLSRSLQQGRRFRCNCFGPNGDPISGKTLVRAAILTAAAGWLTAGVNMADKPIGALFVSLSQLVTAAGIVAIIALLAMARTLLNVSALTNGALAEEA